MAVTALDIVNQALQLVGDNQPPVTGAAPAFDSSPAGVAASKLYAPCVATVQRQFEWDASRNMVALVATGNAAPFPWSFEYGYPTNGIQVWQIMPATAPDINDPISVRWSVGNTLVLAAQTKVIWTNLAAAVAVYNNNPNENTWDSGFREAVVRLLASELAMAVAGKPDLAQVMLESGGSFGGAATERRN
jgi:hypothetical protein